MACSLPCGSSLPRHGTENAVRRRLGLAMCASMLAHAWLLAACPGALSGPPPATAAWDALSARIAAGSSASAEGDHPEFPVVARTQPAQNEGSARPAPAVGIRPSDLAEPVHAEKSKSTRSLERRPTSHSSQFPTPVDANWYTVQDIDVYPRATTPLGFASPQGTGDAVVRMLLWLRIDEHGQVAEVSAGEPGIPAAWVDAARASLTAVRFTPARKDERAVRSRLLLSLRFAPAETGRNADLATDR